MRNQLLFASSLCAVFSVGCDSSSTMMQPMPNAPTYLAVTASDYVAGSGTLSLLDPETLQLQKAVDQIDPSSSVRAFDKKLYVIDSTHGTLRVYDAADSFKTPKDYPIRRTGTLDGTQGNPNDIYVDTARGKLYVTLYGSFGATQVKAATALGVMDLNNLAAGISSFVTLNVAANDTDANPDAGQLVACGDNLYVLLQDLDRNNGYKPVGPGRMGKLSLTNPTTASYIALTGENPTRMATYANCDEALVASAGDQLGGATTGKSGIERVDLKSGKSLGLVLTDTALGGNVSTMDAIDAQHVFVDVSTKSATGYNNTVYTVNAMNATKGTAILGPMSYVPSVRVLGAQLVVLSGSKAAAGQLKPGLYLGAATGVSLPTEPIDFDLPPSSVALVSR